MLLSGLATCLLLFKMACGGLSFGSSLGLSLDCRAGVLGELAEFVQAVGDLSAKWSEIVWQRWVAYGRYGEFLGEAQRIRHAFSQGCLLL